MNKITNNDGVELNSQYCLETLQGVFGLILESWGPSSRNADYNTAFEIILSRLRFLEIPYISINVISSPLMKAFPVFEERTILLNGNARLHLAEYSPKDLRIQIGRQQAKLKVNPDSKGGNNTKRILLHNPTIDRTLWVKIARGGVSEDTYSAALSEITTDSELYKARADSLCLEIKSEPSGILRPRQLSCTISAYERDPRVRAWVLRNANGICDLCQSTTFLKDDRKPYLESHHVIPLAQGGSDTIGNVVALCPNCHRELHHGMERAKHRQRLFNTVERLLK